MCACMRVRARIASLLAPGASLAGWIYSVHRGNRGALVMPCVWCGDRLGAAAAQVQAHRERASFLQTEDAKRDGVISSRFPRRVVDT